MGNDDSEAMLAWSDFAVGPCSQIESNVTLGSVPAGVMLPLSLHNQPSTSPVLSCRPARPTLLYCHWPSGFKKW